MKSGKVIIIDNISRATKTFRYELVERMLENYNITLLSEFHDNDKKIFEELGCKCVNINIDRRGTNPIKDLKLMIEYLKTIISEKPDIVLTFSIKPNIYGGVVCTLLNIPYISTVEGLGSSFNKERKVLRFIVRKLYKFGLRAAKSIFYLNNNIKNVLVNEIKADANKLKFIPGMGVNLNKFNIIPYPKNNNPILVTAGRIMRDKGFIEIINVSNALVKKYPNLKWHICGIPEKGEEYLLDKIKCRPWFIYHGQVDNIVDVIKTTNATVTATYHEGLSTICIESMACGRPVLGTNVYGVKELIINNKNGIKFNAKDESGMYKAIDTFLSLSDKEKELMGSNGRKLVEQKYSRENVVNTYISTINDVVNKNNAN